MIRKYVEENKDRMLEELLSLIRIPNVSAQPAHKEDMVRYAERWKELLLGAGIDRAEVMSSRGSPMVYTEGVVDPNAKTVLVYGHCDVMPAEPFELWEIEPFEPTVKDSHIWACGADDDKGQLFIQARIFEYLNKNDLLKHNMKFISKGEEKIGSGSLDPFIEEHKEFLAYGVILISDIGLTSPNAPSTTAGLCDLPYWQVEMTGPNRDLHSGTFGGVVANPINVLCKSVADVTGLDSKIRIPGFYADIEEASDEECKLVAFILFDEEEYKKSLGVKALFGGKGYSTIERTDYHPAFDVYGIWGGYTGDGAKTVIPSKAYAKFSSHLVPHQNHTGISQLVVDYFSSVTPDYATAKVEKHHNGHGHVCPVGFPACRAAERGFKTVFGKRLLPVCVDSSTPIISTFEKLLDVKTVLVDFGLESNAIRSPNKSMPVDLWLKGIGAVVNFHLEYGREA